MASLHPEHGARMVLERVHEGAGGTRVRYALTVYEPAGVRHEGVADVREGQVALDWRSAPPQWTQTFLERLLRGLAKKHGDDGSWPRKLTRWRQA